jgi:hypothetical protein
MDGKYPQLYFNSRRARIYSGADLRDFFGSFPGMVGSDHRVKRDKGGFFDRSATQLSYHPDNVHFFIHASRMTLWA